MPTMKQIAELAGVSRGTVDRVLNHRGTVSGETARKVREIAATLQYRPSRAARSLASRKRGLRLCYILFDPAANPYFAQVEAGIARKAAELQEYGVTVEELYSSFADPASQDALLEQAVAGGAGGIVIAGFNTAETAARLRRITASGIPVVTANTDIDDSGRLAYVGCDHARSGRTAGGLMRLLTRGSAHVGVLIGSRSVQCHTARLAGFAEQLQRTAPGMEIAGVCENNDDDFESFAVTRTLLEQHPGIDALYIAASGAYGACRAVELRGDAAPRPVIVCHDCLESTRTMLEKGVIAAAICQQPEYQGARPLDLLFNALAMDTPPERENYYTDIDILIRENM